VAELELELEPPPHAASANNAVTKTALRKCLGIGLSPLFWIKNTTTAVIIVFFFDFVQRLL
jgi:hypothetical protein